MEKIYDLGEMNISAKNGVIVVTKMYDGREEEITFDNYEEAVKYRDEQYLYTSRTNTGFKSINVYKKKNGSVVVKLNISYRGKYTIRKTVIKSIDEYIVTVERYLGIIIDAFGLLCGKPKVTNNKWLDEFNLTKENTKLSIYEVDDGDELYYAVGYGSDDVIKLFNYEGINVLHVRVIGKPLHNEFTESKILK